MATEAKRERRRRQRQRKRQARATPRQNFGGGPRATVSSYSVSATRAPGASNPSVWTVETYDLTINSLQGNKGTTCVWCFELNSSTVLKDRLSRSGEYRLLSLTCTYSPISATLQDRIAIAPYFDPINKLLSASEFVANGRRIRRADALLREVWNTPSEVVSVLDPANPEPIIGGVCVYFFEATPATTPATTQRRGQPNDTFGVIDVVVRFSFRGKKTTTANFTAV